MLDKELKDVIFANDANKAQKLLASANLATRVAALSAAAMYGKANVARLLLDLGVDANAQHPGAQPALVSAALGGYPEIVRMLLDRGAMVDVANAVGSSALARVLICADSTKHIEVIDALLQAGANPRKTPNDGDMLAYAIANKRLPGLTKRLLDRGVDPNEFLRGLDCQPLHLAVKDDNPHAIGELLAAGADPTVRAPAGEYDWAELTPLEFAKKVKRKKCASLLEAALGSAAAPATTPTPAKKGAAATLSEELWQRVARRIAQAKGRRAGSLAPGATASDIQSCERTVGFKFGADVAKFFGAHNGQVGGAPAIPVEAPREGGYQLLSLAQAAGEWRTMADLLEGGDFEGLEAEPDAGVKPRWWNRKWLPFASNGQGDLLCLDFDPAKGGRKGQVVEFLHESPGRARLGDSIAAYLSSLED